MAFAAFSVQAGDFLAKFWPPSENWSVSVSVFRYYFLSVHWGHTLRIVLHFSQPLLVRPDLALPFDLCIALNWPFSAIVLLLYRKPTKQKTLCKYIIRTASLRCVHWVFCLVCMQEHKRKFVLSACKYDDLKWGDLYRGSTDLYNMYWQSLDKNILKFNENAVGFQPWLFAIVPMGCVKLCTGQFKE